MPFQSQKQHKDIYATNQNLVKNYLNIQRERKKMIKYLVLFTLAVGVYTGLTLYSSAGDRLN